MKLIALETILKQKALDPQRPRSAGSTAVSRSGSQVHVFPRALRVCPAGDHPVAVGSPGGGLPPWMESATGLTTGPRPLTGIVGARGTPLWLVCEEGTWVPVNVLRLPEVSLMPRWGSSRSSRFLSSDSVFFTCLCYFKEREEKGTVPCPVGGVPWQWGVQATGPVWAPGGDRGQALGLSRAVRASRVFDFLSHVPSCACWAQAWLEVWGTQGASVPRGAVCRGRGANSVVAPGHRVTTRWEAAGCLSMRSGLSCRTGV